VGGDAGGEVLVKGVIPRGLDVQEPPASPPVELAPLDHGRMSERTGPEGGGSGRKGTEFRGFVGYDAEGGAVPGGAPADRGGSEHLPHVDTIDPKVGPVLDGPAHHGAGSVSSHDDQGSVRLQAAAVDGRAVCL